MKTREEEEDTLAIRALVGTHFDGMKWSPGTTADWDRFAGDFLGDAVLVPAARPAQVRTLGAFIERMKSVAAGPLHTFEERTLGMEVLLFGHVAVVLAASKLLENASDVNHDISGYLLVKTAGEWRIAAHAWDKVTQERPLPERLR